MSSVILLPGLSRFPFAFLLSCQFWLVRLQLRVLCICRKSHKLCGGHASNRILYILKDAETQADGETFGS